MASCDRATCRPQASHHITCLYDDKALTNENESCSCHDPAKPLWYMKSHWDLAKPQTEQGFSTKPMDHYPAVLLFLLLLDMSQTSQFADCMIFIWTIDSTSYEKSK